MVHLQTTSHPHISGESTVDTDCPQNMNQRFSGGGGVRQCREEMRGATTGRGMRGLAIIIPRILLLLAIVNSVLGGSTYIDENGVEVFAAPMEHSGTCDDTQMTTGTPCVLPVNANVTILDRGAGTRTPADVTIDVYPSMACGYKQSTSIFYAWECSPTNVEPAVIHDFIYKTVIRIIFPPGYNTSAARLKNAGADGVGTVHVGGLNYTNDTAGAVRFRKVMSPLRLSEGVSDPGPQNLPIVQYKWNDILNQLERVTPKSTIDFRTGITFGERDPISPSWGKVLDASRFLEIETVEESATEATNNYDAGATAVTSDGAQRLVIGLEGLVNSRNVGGVGSAIGMGERFYAVQIYKAKINPAKPPEQGYLMRYYNQRINDPCVFSKPIAGSPGSCPEDWRLDKMLDTSVITLPWFAATRTDEVVLLCPAGTSHRPRGGGTVCDSCAPGHYSPVTMSTACSTCPAGTSADVSATALIPGGGASACLLCRLGKFSLAASAACSDCPMGTYSGVGKTSCTSCPVATYSSVAGASSCTSCPTATTTSSPGASSPSRCVAACPLGSSSLNGVQPCLQCPAGTFANATGSTVCSLCSPGSASSTPGAVNCQTCPPGSFSESGGEPECNLCPKATYSEGTGSTSCRVCGADLQARKFMAESGLDSASLGQVYVDQVSPLGVALTADAVILRTTVVGASSREMCFPNCLPGRLGASSMGVDASSAGGGGCRSCGEGTYNRFVGMSSCLNCELGFFASATGSTQCDQCAPGTFAGRPGSSRCAVCPAGQASAAQGGSSSGGTVSETDACYVCLPGTYTSSPGSPRCVPCQEGAQSGEGSLGCERCPIGSYTFGDMSTTRCQGMGERGVVGMWDVWMHQRDSEYTRSRRTGSGCNEVFDSWVSPSTVLDWSNTLGDAVLMGPPCRALTGWDKPQRDSLGLHSFAVSNGRVEALEFDGKLNTGLVVAADEGIEGLMETKPWVVPMNELSVEMWLTLDGQATSIRGLAGAYQSDSGYSRGWALNHVYDTNRKDSWFVSFTLATDATHGPGSLGVITGSGLNIIEAKVTPPPAVGTWFHLAVTYNGSVAKIYLDGDLLTEASPCGGGLCGGIVYPLPSDLRTYKTPLTIGSTMNGAGSSPVSHRGMMRWVRIYNVTVPQSQISSRWAFGKLRYSDSKRTYTPWYWASLSSLNVSSPSTLEVSVDINTLGPRLVRQGALESINILGRFGVPPARYRTVWSLGAVNQSSEDCVVQNIDGTAANPATSHFGEVLSCPFPLWSYGRTSSASLSVVMAGIGEVWQTACLNSLCGYSSGQTSVSNGPWWQAGGFHALNGTRFDFAFIATDCAEGTFAPEGGVSPYCRPCLQGSYSDQPGSVTCTLCPKGTYSELETGATICVSCPPGLFTKGLGSTSPTDCQPVCPAGSFSSSRLEPCSLCPQGTFSAQAGSATCDDCPSGSWTRGEGSAECISRCTPGQYEADWGLDPCFKCPEGFYSLGLGSKSCVACGLGQWSTRGANACQLCNVTCELAKDTGNAAIKNQCCTG